MFIRTCAAVLVWGIYAGMATAEETSSWTQLPLSTCKVDEFIKANPESDGRGVVIAVLDTGVDPSIPGLTLTPDGETKVIDLQDFSGEGDTDLHRVRSNEAGTAVIEYDEDGVPVEYALPAIPKGKNGEERLFWFATLKESKFVNSDVPDLNDNGKEDDEFAICVTALDGDGDDQAVCFVDTDLDRSFADEKPLQNYRLKYDTFRFGRAEPEKQIEPMTFAVNIFLRKPKVVFLFDDGAHGTHVAGIAAGYKINNQEGFNGVAPGAKVMGLKIGQGAIGGISTTDSMKKCYEYAARYARENGVPVVCNMSYGVESTIEGNSDLEDFLNELMRENPYFMVCTSAGNEGPGLSSVGNPACADEIISVAALMAAPTGRDIRGFDMDGPIVAPFSSRGGESGKPDIATPGWVTSTVPRYVRTNDFWPGTSMASPHAAGLCALLISDAMAANGGKPVRARDVRSALRQTAYSVPNATSLDMGWGIPNMLAASKMLRKLVTETAKDAVLGYEVTTDCPHGHKGKAAAAYWRGTWFPTDKPQVFTIEPVFAPGTDMATRTAFTRKFELRSNSPWCLVDQESVYLRSEQDTQVYVNYDAKQLTKPGLYVGSVEGLYNGRVAFRLTSTIIIPHRFDAEGDFSGVIRNQVVDGWTVNRHFVAVPAGASAMHLTFAAPEGKDSQAGMNYVYGPTGGENRRRDARLDTDSGKRKVEWTFTDKLTPGVWEIPVLANRPDKQWPYDLEIRFDGLHAEPKEISSWDGGSGELSVTNIFERPVLATASGKLEGFRTYKEDEFKGLKDTLSYTVKLDERFKGIRLKLEMTREAYAETTDIGVAVLHDGKDLAGGAFSNRIYTDSIRNPGGESTLTVKINGGFAVSDDKRKTPITVKIDYLLAEPLSIDVGQGGESSRVNFVPGVPIALEYEVDGDIPDAPDGTRPVGYLSFDERGSDLRVLTVPIDIAD